MSRTRSRWRCAMREASGCARRWRKRGAAASGSASPAPEPRASKTAWYHGRETQERIREILKRMIGRLTGELLQCGPQEVVLDVGGVGYLLRIPLSTFYAVSGRPNGSVSLHVHTHVREDALFLFGFATAEERSAFERLISISGVGPRIALEVLSGIGVAELEEAVER